jgi:hypothetical protein
VGPVYKFKQPFSFYLPLTDSLFADYQGFTDFLIRFPLFSTNRQCQELKEKSDRIQTTEEFRPICRGFARCFDLFHRAATYVDKILKGAKPADPPVEQPTKLEFIVNLRAAK